VISHRKSVLSVSTRAPRLGWLAGSPADRNVSPSESGGRRWRTVNWRATVTEPAPWPFGLTPAGVETQVNLARSPFMT
jgi:hypothetical protein